MADPSILSAYPIYDEDKELERAKYLGLMRMGLGMAGREPIGSAASAGINTIFAGQEKLRREMMLRLQAYAKQQEILAKQQEAAQRAAFQQDIGKIPNAGQSPLTAMGPGGPTPANAAAVGAAPAAITQYQRLLQIANLYDQRGMSEQAKRYYDAAKEMRDKYSSSPTYIKDANNKLRIAQLSETGAPLIHGDITPAEEQTHFDVGGGVQTGGKYSGPGAVIPKTMTFTDKIAAQNAAIARAAEARAAGPQWDAGSGQWIARPTAASPTGSAVTPQGYAKSAAAKNAPEAYSKQIAGIVNVGTAIESYLGELKNWSNFDLANPGKRAQIGTAYNNTMLQLKEAYNLGVLNETDYEILTTVLTDPLSKKGVVTSNKAIEAQANQLREVLARNARNLAKVYKQPEEDVDKLFGPPAAKAPTAVTSEAAYNKLPSGAEYIAPDGSTRRKK